MINVIVHSRMHDEACVVSAEFEADSNDSRALIAALTAEMERVAQWAERSGSIIGHLKAFAEPCEGSVTLSTVGGAVSASGSIAWDVGLTGIVFGTELAEAESQIAGAAVAALNALGEVAQIEKCDEEHVHSHEHGH